jgi:hypothetical protein
MVTKFIFSFVVAAQEEMLIEVWDWERIMAVWESVFFVLMECSINWWGRLLYQ